MFDITKSDLNKLDKMDLIRLIHLFTYTMASERQWNDELMRQMSMDNLQEMIIRKELRYTKLDKKIKERG